MQKHHTSTSTCVVHKMNPELHRVYKELATVHIKVEINKMIQTISLECFAHTYASVVYISSSRTSRFISTIGVILAATISVGATRCAPTFGTDCAVAKL